MGLQSSCWLGLQSHLKAQLGLEDPLLRSFMWLLAGNLSSSLATCWRPRFLGTGLLHQQLAEMAACFLQNKELKRGAPPREKYSIFYKLILKMTYHHFCHIVWVHSDQPWYSTSGDCTRMWISGRGGHLGLSWRLPATSAYSSIRKKDPSKQKNGKEI